MNETLPDVAKYERELAKLMKENGLRHEDLMDFTECGILPEHLNNATFEMRLREVLDKIATGHYYHFVGRVGQFCPILPGNGGGLLMRESGGKYSAATGSKGYRWMESEMVSTLGKEECIDRGYYDKLVNDAKDAISKYGDFEWFVSEDRYDVPPEG